MRGGEIPDPSAAKTVPERQIGFYQPSASDKADGEDAFPHQEHTILQDLRETDFGLFEGKTQQNLWTTRHTAAGWILVAREIPGGESVQKIQSTVLCALCQAMTMLSAEGAAFVVHGGTIMAILEAFARPRRSITSTISAMDGC